MKIDLGKVFVAGHRGMVGGAIARKLEARGVELVTRTRRELDLRDQAAVYAFMADQKPDAVILAAAKVGGIMANDSYPAEFIHDNLVIQNNIIHGAHLADVERLLFLGSSCIYPRMADQPMREDALLTGTLEPTNEPYAIAKIAGIKMCESYNRQYGRDYRSVMPTNLYGPGDNFHPENSHVIPALIRRFHEAAQVGAKAVTLWGSGTPKREFLHVDDMADGCLHVMDLDKASFDKIIDPRLSHINIGTGEDLSILAMAQMVAEVTGFTGTIELDHTKPDGTPRKLMDVSQLGDLGWTARIQLDDGLRETYAWFLAHQDDFRAA
jgi:nucleoside-diphosphate-sugar epimerase